MRFLVHNGMGTDSKNNGKSPARTRKKGHKPGRGHRRKSDPEGKKRFQRQAKKKREATQAAYEEAAKRWEAMTPKQRRFRPELDPERLKEQ
jgi:hypothetical protein